MPRLFLEAINSTPGFWEIPGAAALAAALAAAAALRSLPGTIPGWIAWPAICGTAGLTRLLGTWCSDPALGFVLTASAIMAGVLLQSQTAPPVEEEATVWAAGAGLLLSFLPSLLRFLGLNMADARLLTDPLGSPSYVFFVLGQAWLVAALAALAVVRAGRGILGLETGLAARCAPWIAALASAATASLLEPSVWVAGAGAVVTLGAALRARPWSYWRTRPLRARAVALAPGLALALAARAPGLMRDVWTARLDAAYPGGRFLSLIDDGARTRAFYEFSTRDRVCLRDGVLEPCASVK